MTHFHQGDAPHWYCHVEMDVIDAEGAREYLRDQTVIEERNGMESFEFFANDFENPSRVVLLECFPDDATQTAHIENIRGDRLASVFTNYRITVYGNPPRSSRERMLAHGFWPPAFEGEFRHFPYFMGFRI